MKKSWFIVLCAVVFLLGVSAGAAWLSLSPRGVLRAVRAEDVMQEKIDAMTREDWRSEYVRLCAPDVTAFEDASAVAGHLFDAAVPEANFTFREVSAGDREIHYILAAGDADVLAARLTYADGDWTPELLPLDAISASTRTVTVTVPEDAAVTLNGRPVGEEYITDSNLPYPDMTALERRFDAVPCLVRYAVPGIYENVRVDVRREGGVVLLRADGTDWSYTRPDAGAYCFCVTAPETAVVTVNGTALTDGDVSATVLLPSRLTIPEELQTLVPSYRIYAAGGLYTEPEITASLPDGTVLSGEGSMDCLTFSLPGSDLLYANLHGRVEEYLRSMCEYNGGHTGEYHPTWYAVSGSDLQNYFIRATDSLYWTQGVTVTFQEISSSDYFSLGDDAFLCRGHVQCTTTTRYQTVDLDMDYEMLWVNSNGTWLIQDMAFI